MSEPKPVRFARPDDDTALGQDISEALEAHYAEYKHAIAFIHKYLDDPNIPDYDKIAVAIRFVEIP